MSEPLICENCGEPERPGVCHWCGKPYQQVRPGKTQPTCECEPMVADMPPKPSPSLEAFARVLYKEYDGGGNLSPDGLSALAYLIENHSWRAGEGKGGH